MPKRYLGVASFVPPTNVGLPQQTRSPKIHSSLHLQILTYDLIYCSVLCFFQLIIEWTIFPPGSINLNKKYHPCLSQPNVPILSAPSSHVQGKTSWGILLPQAGVGGTKWATTGHICLGKSWPLHAMTHSLPYMGLPSGTIGKEPACQWRRLPGWEEIPWRRAWQPTLVFLPGEFHGQRSLAGYSPLGCKESDMTEVT